MAGLLLGAFIRAISIRSVFYCGLLLERSQYGGCFTGGLYLRDVSMAGVLLGAFIRAISVWWVFDWGLLLERFQ